MPRDTVTKFFDIAEKKTAALETSLRGYLILSALAGIYLGFGIVLIFTIGAPLAAAGHPLTRLFMGASFGIALTLVVFAGAELFTGNNMFMTVAGLQGRVSWARIGKLFFWCYVGNLLGSLLIAWLAANTGLLSGDPQAAFIAKVAAIKMGAPFAQIFVRGILANWLVCLALWTASRANGDGAKLALIFWCLFAFVTSGYEHSIANMSLLSLALFLPHPASVTWAGFVNNLVPSTLGNMVGGGIGVGALYWLALPENARIPARSLEPAIPNTGAERLGEMR